MVNDGSTKIHLSACFPNFLIVNQLALSISCECQYLCLRPVSTQNQAPSLPLRWQTLYHHITWGQNFLMLKKMHIVSVRFKIFMSDCLNTSYFKNYGALSLCFRYLMKCIQNGEAKSGVTVKYLFSDQKFKGSRDFFNPKFLEFLYRKRAYR